MSRHLYKWNPVFNFVMEVKDSMNEIIKNKNSCQLNYDKQFITENGVIKEISCLESWILNLKNKEYIDRISALQINQLGTMLLIRYGRYSDIFSGENDINNDNFWDLYDGFYKECRSVVIDVENETIVLAPFKKFRNLNEGEENQLSVIIEKIKNAKCVEFSDKMDGSMQSARWYNNQIIMAGSQAIDKDNSWRLQDGYNMLMSNKNYVDLIKHYSLFTFIFEYISTKDAHVVSYTKEQEGLYLLGMRHITNSSQVPYNCVKDLADVYNVKMTKLFNKTLDEVIVDLSKYKSHEKEGYVLNIDGYMLKIKCDDYVQIHKILSNISSINLIIKSIADNTFDDLVSKVPESYKWRVNKVANLVLNYIKNTEVFVNQYFITAPKQNKKDFMIWIDKNVPVEYKGYVRNKYLGKENNYIKSGSNICPSYKKLKDMGINENYSAIFVSEE